MERYGWNAGQTDADPDTTPRQELPTARHVMHSTTKSFLSALLGDRDCRGDDPHGVDTHAADWFPDYASLSPSADKSLITSPTC